MDHECVINNAVDFICERYSENILVEDIAEHVHLSSSYFAYVFRKITGYSVKDYLNRYRLYRAAEELIGTDRRIVDIVYENGFSSQQAFNRSFTQIYGLPPAMFKRLRAYHEPFPPVNQTEKEVEIIEMTEISQEYKDVLDKAKFIVKDSFYVIGIEVDIDYKKSDEYGTEALYKRWYRENLIERIPNKVNAPHVCYGITHDSSEDDLAKHIMCVEVSDIRDIPEGFVWRKFDTQLYAVFSCVQDIALSWDFQRHIFKRWVKEQGFEIPEFVSAEKDKCFTKLPIIESYNIDDFIDYGNDGTINLYIPIQRK